MFQVIPCPCNHHHGGNVKQEIITWNWTYNLPHELLNNLGFMILRNEQPLWLFTWVFFDLMIPAFEHGTRRFELVTRGFELVTRRFERVTQEFELVTCEFGLVTCGFELVIPEFELVTRGV